MLSFALLRREQTDSVFSDSTNCSACHLLMCDKYYKNTRSDNSYSQLASCDYLILTINNRCDAMVAYISIYFIFNRNWSNIEGMDIL